MSSEIPISVTESIAGYRVVRHIALVIERWPAADNIDSLLRHLRNQAITKGGNAVVGVKFMESKFGLYAYGNAVIAVA